MNVGPSHGAGSPSPKRELPGEFVSDDLRNDCARFLDELRQLVELRRELTPDSAAWAPAGRVILRHRRTRKRRIEGSRRRARPARRQ
jgi:hypothetical protein